MRGVETRRVDCPYCGERVTICVESDVRGELVQDCEVCCNPWRVRICVDQGVLRIVVGRLDD